MNEPKRRGRPPKAKLLQPAEPNARIEGADCPSCGQAEGHYDDCEVGMGAVANKEDLSALVAAVSAAMPAGAQEHIAAQAYAERVWAGQSVDVPRAEKLRRVARALEGQGLSMEGVKL